MLVWRYGGSIQIIHVGSSWSRSNTANPASRKKNAQQPLGSSVSNRIHAIVILINGRYLRCNGILI
jgi:hypothetical protein